MKQIITLALALLVISCAKGDKSCRESRGGFLPQFSRVFFKTKDFAGGPITIEITRTEDGVAQLPIKLNTTVSGNVTCETSAGVVKASLTTGYDYSYHAYDNSRTWNGSIPSSCTSGSCETIELK